MKSNVLRDRQEIEQIIKRCEVCNLAMVDMNGFPYVIPMNYGFDHEVIYLHSSATGKKIEILEQNNRVCLSFSTDHVLRWQSEKVACSYSMKYRSVLVHGHVQFVEDFEEKIIALNSIMKQYTDREFKYNDPAVKEVKVFKVIIERMEGREYGY